MEVKLQGIHVHVQGVFHCGDGVLRIQSGASAVGLYVNGTVRGRCAAGYCSHYNKGKKKFFHITQ